MSRFIVHDTPIAGLKVVQRISLLDARGFLSRLFCDEELRSAGWSKPIAQINRTRTHALGSVRGLHFQHSPHAEMKLVNCIRGKVFDVAVDLRRGSPTFLKWYGIELSEDNDRSLLIPEYFAHGFQTLLDESELLYFHSCAYHPASEGAVHVADPRVGIAWPLPIGELSDRDRGHPMLAASFDGISS